MSGMIPPSQRARDAAADALSNMGVDWGACGDVREGRIDHPLPNAFAAFEQATLAEQGDAGAGWEFLDNLRQVNGERLVAWEAPKPIMLCEHCGYAQPKGEGAASIYCAPPFEKRPHEFTKPHPFMTQEPRKTDGIFHAVELGGEVGEVLNVVKKLHREAMGWRGSRATVEQLADEIGDVMICLDKLAGHYGINIQTATRAKFNATSDKVGLPHKLYASRISAPADEWQDIDGAPRDGTEIDLWGSARGSTCARVPDCKWLHNANGSGWNTRGDKGWEPLKAIGWRPTHFRPLPLPPKETRDGE